MKKPRIQLLIAKLLIINLLNISFTPFVTAKEKVADSLYKSYLNELKQHPVDYIKVGKKLFYYVDFLRFNDLEKAKQYIDTLKYLAEKTNLDINHGHYLYQLGMLQKYELLVKSAEKNLKESLNYYQSGNNNAGIANCYNGIAIIQADKANYLEALKLFIEAKKYYAKENIKPAVQQTIMNMARLSELIGDEKGAEMYLKEGLKEESNNRLILSQLAELQLRNKQYKEALKNVKKVFEVIKEGKELVFLSEAYSTYSRYYFITEKYDSAAVMMQKSIETALEYKNYQLIVEHYRSLAQIYVKQGKLNEARKAIKDGFEWIEKTGDVSNTQFLYENLSQIEGLAGNYKEAFEAHLKSTEIKDSLQNINNMAEFEKAKAEMDVLEKENKIALLNQEKELKEKEMQRQKLLRNSLMIALIALLILMAFIINQRNKLQKSKKEIEKKNQELEKLNKAKNQIFSIIGHDLRKPFINISSITEMLKNNLISKIEFNSLVDNLQETNKQTLEILDMLLLWGAATTQEKNTKKEQLELKSTIDFNIQFYKNFSTEKNITIINNTQTIIFLNSHKNQLNFILRNLISNAIKFSYNNSEIIVSAEENQEDIRISVKDFGVGMTQQSIDLILNENKQISTLGTQNERGYGLGLHMVHEFLLENNGKLHIESKPNAGSTFTVIFNKNLA